MKCTHAQWFARLLQPDLLPFTIPIALQFGQLNECVASLWIKGDDFRGIVGKQATKNGEPQY